MGVATEGTEDTEIIAEKYHSTRSALDRSMITGYWFPDRREPLPIAFPRIRAVRLESLPRARRGGPPQHLGYSHARHRTQGHHDFHKEAGSNAAGTGEAQNKCYKKAAGKMTDGP